MHERPPLGETLVEAMSQDLIDKDEVLKQKKFNPQNQMVHYANEYRETSLIQPGDRFT